MALLELILITAVFIISAIPLYFAAKIAGGESSLLKAVLTNLAAGFATALIYLFFWKFAALISFIALIFIYKMMFKIGWLRAFLVWILSGLIAFILILILLLVGFLVI